MARRAMTLADALEHWRGKVTEDGIESGGFMFVLWVKRDDSVILDGTFSATDLEAIAIIMREQGDRL